MMLDESDALLDSLLRDWHRWAAREEAGIGFPSENVSCKLYRTSRQHDDTNGALDGDINAFLMAGVDRCIHRMADPWRTAIAINARNLSCGISVWRSARLPIDDMERALIVAESRVRVLRMLQADGLA